MAGLCTVVEGGLVGVAFVLGRDGGPFVKGRILKFGVVTMTVSYNPMSLSYLPR